MNAFYHLHLFIQWVIATLMFFSMLGIMLFWILMVQGHLWASLSIFILIPLSQFLVTPLYTLLGLYVYLSPMLLVVNGTKKKYDLHNGTTFDYLWIMHEQKPGRDWQKTMLCYYISGLLEIIRKIEEGDLSNTLVIRGSSYFFSERTAKKLGFEIEKTEFPEQLNLALNYLDLLWTYSASKGKWALPNLKRIKTASIQGHDLCQKKDELLRLSKILNQKQ